jgi:hypothetical protein
MIRDFLRIFPAWVWISGALAVAAVVTIMLVSYQRDRAATETAKAHSAAVVAEGQAKAASAAAEAVAANAERQAKRDTVERGNRDDILSQPGASAPVDPGVSGAVLAGLCRRQSYHDHPRCVELRRQGSASAP